MPELDPELAELQENWLQAREYDLGLLSRYSDNLQDEPPDIAQPSASSSTSTRRGKTGKTPAKNTPSKPVAGLANSKKV